MLQQWNFVEKIMTKLKEVSSTYILPITDELSENNSYLCVFSIGIVPVVNNCSIIVSHLC